VARYTNETNRLYGVLNKRLADRPFVAGDYSVADMAIWPWIVPHKNQGQDLDSFPNLKAWFERVSERPAVQAGMKLGEALRNNTLSAQGRDAEKARSILFGQTART
jgi:glutathione S-transferase